MSDKVGCSGRGLDLGAWYNYLELQRLRRSCHFYVILSLILMIYKADKNDITVL